MEPDCCAALLVCSLLEADICSTAEFICRLASRIWLTMWRRLSSIWLNASARSPFSCTGRDRSPAVIVCAEEAIERRLFCSV